MKFFVLILAVVSFQALSTEAWRKCFEVTDPVPTTAPPATTTTEAPPPPPPDTTTEAPTTTTTAAPPPPPPPDTTTAAPPPPDTTTTEAPTTTTTTAPPPPPPDTTTAAPPPPPDTTTAPPPPPDTTTTQAPTTTTPAPTPAPTTQPPPTTPAPPPRIHECAVWSRYNNDLAPETNGFSAGISAVSGTEAYVGFGMYGDRRLPGRVQTRTAAGKNPGSYVPWGIEIKVDYPEYLVLPQNCSCEWIAPATAVTLNGVIYTGDPLFQYAVGRKVFANGQVAISRVITNPAPAYDTTRYNQAYINGAGSEVVLDNPATEILVCRSPNPPTGRPVIEFPTEACGVWSTVGMTNYVTTNGFNAGTSRINNTAWVGRGQQAGQFQVGRYQNEATTGTYTAWAGDRLTDYGSEWLIVPQGCTCEWLAPSRAKPRKGLVTAPDSGYNFMVGRKTFSTGQVSVSRVWFLNSWEWYNELNNVDGAGWSTEILVCETLPPPPQQCALWMRYNDDAAPATIGFSAGTSATNNATAYVGRGTYGALRVPGRIQTTTVGTRTPGIYLAVAGEFKANYEDFLVVQPDCTCSWQPVATASDRNGVVFTGDPFWFFAVGRKVFADGRVAISRVHFRIQDPGTYMRQAYIASNGAEVYENATELLVCETTVSTAKPPAINFPTEACGVWSSINMVESVRANGFSAGISRVNDDAYVGRGMQADQFQIGRYQLNETAGVYTAWGGDRLVSYGSEWLIVPQGCTCRWLTPNAAKARKGLVLAPDNVWGFMVGRKIFRTGQVSVSRVHYTTLTQWYTHLLNYDVADYASELLVCENVPPPPNACALWTRFNNDDGPAVNGFAAGRGVITNTTAYVGYGTSGMARIPARVQITSTNFNGFARSTGAWMSSGVEVRAKYAEYLVVANGCTCSWMAWSIASSRPGLVLTGDVNDVFAVGRKTFANGLVAISRVITDATDIANYGRQFYNDGSNLQQSEAAGEVLVCETTQSTAVPPVFTLKDESCGVWSGINMVNSVTANGFLAGTSRTGELAFVGRGQQAAEFQTGRFQDNATTGTYTAWGGDKLTLNSQWLIVPEGCSCKWTDPWKALIRKGLVTAPDDTYNFIVGRVNFTTGAVSVSRVSYTTLTQWYTNANNIDTSDQSTQLLVCENIPDPPPGCAYWARYNYDMEPSRVGFLAGTARDGSDAYVGFGNWGDVTIPGRIKLGTGVIVPWGGDQTPDYPEYLVVPQNCSCSWMAPGIASNRPGYVQVSEREYLYAVGRVQLGGGQIAISRVATKPIGLYYQQWWTAAAGNELTSTPATEVLVCESTSPDTAAARPVIAFANQACGVWSLVNTDNYVTTQGFLAGTTSFVNTNVYVGRGIYTGEFEVGRYQNEDSQTWVAFGAEQRTSTSEYLVVPQGCRCKWMDRWAAWIRRGTVTAPDSVYNFMVGRVNFTTGQTSVSRVRGHYNTNFEQWFATSATTWTSNLDTKEILSCDNLPDPLPNPCALWTKYNGDNAPTVNGFNAGISAYNSAANSTAWLARGFRDSWLMPGRVQISGTSGLVWLTGPGEGNIGLEWNPNWSNAVPFAAQEYLVVRNGCTCSWMHPSTASDRPGLVRTSENYVSHDFVPFRWRYADNRVSIGRTSMSSIWAFKTWYTQPDGIQVELNTAAEVRDIKEWLVCESDQDMSVRPTIAAGFGGTGKACGMWARYADNTWPASHGFAFGLDRTNNTGYVARGSVADIIFICRLSLVGTPRIYCPESASEPAGTQPEYLVVPEGCNCQWVAYASAKTRAGLVRSIDNNWSAAVGRKAISATQFTVSTVHTIDNWQRYVNAAGVFVIDSAITELLVCEST